MSVYRDLLKKVDDTTAAPQGAAIVDPGFSLNENLREDVGLLAHRLIHLRASKKINTIMFCGVEHGCGVTTIVKHLAVELLPTLSGNSEKILILNGTESGDRLRRLISGELEAGEAVVPLTERIDSLAGDTMDGFWLRKIGTGRLATTLKELKERYAWILMDMPAATQNQNLIYSAVSDGVVLVVESGRSRVPNVQAMIEHFQSFAVQLLGVVVNRKRMEIPQWLYNMLFARRR